MSLMKRVSLIFRSKANTALDRAEDPRETLDYSYQRQLDLLAKVRRGVADVATSRKRIELQINQLEQQATKLQGQAQKAIDMDREDLAREALTRKSGLSRQIDDLKAQHAQLQGEEEKLTLAQQRLQAKVESFRTRKETIKATYTAAEAQTRIGEAMSGIGEEMGDVGMAIQRAEDKTANMQARAGAIDELIASGALDDASSLNRGDDISRELDADELAVRRRARAGRGSRAAAPQPAGESRPRPPAEARPSPRPSRQAERGAGMIVRILGEGQYDVADDALDRLNELDAAVEAAVESGDEAAFAPALAALLDGVRTVGVAAPGRRARRVRPDPARRRRHHRRGPRAARRRRAHPRLRPSAGPVTRRRGLTGFSWDVGDNGSMAQTRFIDDRGLTARMTLVMFLLGGLFVVLIVGLMLAFKRPASRIADRRHRPRHRLVPVVPLRHGGDEGDAGTGGDARGGARAARA